jgi:hypothetical protein
MDILIGPCTEVRYICLDEVQRRPPLLNLRTSASGKDAAAHNARSSQNARSKQHKAARLWSIAGTRYGQIGWRSVRLYIVQRERRTGARIHHSAPWCIRLRIWVTEPRNRSCAEIKTGTVVGGDSHGAVAKHSSLNHKKGINGISDLARSAQDRGIKRGKGGTGNAADIGLVRRAEEVQEGVVSVVRIVVDEVDRSFIREGGRGHDHWHVRCIGDVMDAAVIGSSPDCESQRTISVGVSDWGGCKQQSRTG